MGDTLQVVEPASVLILILFLALMLRRGLRASLPDGGPSAGDGDPTGRSRLRALADIALLGAASWVAEDTCIHLYDFYQYDAPWRLFLDEMPLLVAVIWPFVILSAREVCHALGFVQRGGPAAGRPHPLAVGLLVLYDASLVEPVAVRSGLWSWNEPGLFDVPLIGLLGWSFFAGVASALLDRLAGWRRLTLLVLAPLATHLLLLATWWGALRWGLRSPAPVWWAAGGSVVLATALALWIQRLRARGRLADLGVMLPRMMAAGLFFGLLLWRGRGILPLVLYGLPFAAPYLMATRFRPSASKAPP